MIDQTTRTLVRQRASYRCEYCRLPQASVEILFHIEHIVARQHGGDDDPNNLALARDRCNLHKGTNLTGIDPDTRQLVALFNPRKEHWFDHFGFIGPRIEGRTAVGRATVRLLQMNALRRIQLRTGFLAGGLFTDTFTTLP
jgi:hypothetical protein